MDDLAKPTLKSGLVFVFQILRGCYYLTHYDADMYSLMCSTNVCEAAKHTPTALADTNGQDTYWLPTHSKAYVV